MFEISKLTELRKLLLDMEQTLGLTDLSTVERDIYYAANELSRGEIGVRTIGLIEHDLLKRVSRPTFFRALKSLVNKGYLSQQADGKRGLYLVHAPNS